MNVLECPTPDQVKKKEAEDQMAKVINSWKGFIERWLNNHGLDPGNSANIPLDRINYTIDQPGVQLAISKFPEMLKSDGWLDVVLTIKDPYNMPERKISFWERITGKVKRDIDYEYWKTMFEYKEAFINLRRPLDV